MPSPDEMRAEVEKRVKPSRAASYFINVGTRSGSGSGSTPPVSLRLDDSTLAAIARYGNPRGLHLSASIRELLSEALANHAEEAPHDQD